MQRQTVRAARPALGDVAYGLTSPFYHSLSTTSRLTPPPAHSQEYARPKSPAMRSKAWNYEAGSPSADGAGGGSSRQAQGASACSDFGRRQELARWQEQGYFDEDADEVEGMEQLMSHRGLLSNRHGSSAQVVHAVSREGVDRNEREEEGKQMQEDEEEDGGWGSDGSEAFMQRLIQQGGLVSVPSRAADSAGDRPRDPTR